MLAPPVAIALLRAMQPSMHILFSVRIMENAWIFEVRRGVYHVPSAGARVRQHLQRLKCAARIDISNPTRYNAFVWCSDYDEIADHEWDWKEYDIAFESRRASTASTFYGEEQKS
jgi:hypothetical protein